MPTNNPLVHQQPHLFTCRKCNHHEFALQLRNVVVTVGWTNTQVAAVSPCRMCTKCGDTTVIVDARVGDLVDPTLALAQMSASNVPKSAPPAMPLESVPSSRKARRRAGAIARKK